MSLPEVLLWRELRQATDTKVRRQHPVGSFVLDFYIPAAKVGVEIDGIAHDMGDRPQRDADRDAWLAARGIALVRIAAAEVLADPAAVADAIVRLAEARR